MAPSKSYILSFPPESYASLIIRKWSPTRSSSLTTIPIHSCTYSASFSPHFPSTLSSVSSDSHLRVFDLRTPSSATNHLTLTIPIHSLPSQHLNPSYQLTAPSEALTHDWNKYRPSIIAAAGVDRQIRTFDIRSPNQGPLAILPGHDYAIRKIAWSPHLSDVLLSASYDMTCRVWTDGIATGIEKSNSAPQLSANMNETPGRGDPLPFGGGGGGDGRELGRMGVHTEFVMGVDWCLFGSEGWCASCGWDEKLLVWDVRTCMMG